MITATFDEDRYQVVPVEPTNENLLDLAMLKDTGWKIV